MWISSGSLDLHHGTVEKFIWNLAEGRVEFNTLTDDVILTFHYLLQNDICVPVSGYMMNQELTINPGKSRLFAAWFKAQDDIPCVLCHIPKHPTHLLKNQIVIEFDNPAQLLQEVDIVNVDKDNKLTIVDKSWKQMKETFNPKQEYINSWQTHIASKWGSIEWQMLGEPFYKLDTDLNNNRTIINISHILGLYESICYLTGLEIYKTLGFHNIIYSSYKRS